MGVLSSYAPVRQLHGEWDKSYPEVCVARASNWSAQASSLIHERSTFELKGRASATEFQRDVARTRLSHIYRSLSEIRTQIKAALNEVGHSALSAEASLLRDRVELDCADLDAFLAHAAAKSHG